MGGLNTTTGIKESTTDVSANVMPASSVGSVATSQMGSNVQPGSGEDWNYGTELPCN